MIHEIETEYGTIEYTVSSGGLWVPGVYDSKKAAKYALKFSDDVPRTLRDKVKADDSIMTKVITFDMLRGLKHAD